MSLVSYLQTHLAGSEAGARLFARSARSQTHPAARAALSDMQEEVVGERDRLRALLGSAGGSPSRVLAVASAAGERLGRLVPHGSLLHRTAMTDLTELEALRTAVSGKLAGFEALLAVADRHDELDPEELTRLRDQAARQLEQLGVLHLEAASRALT